MCSWLNIKKAAFELVKLALVECNDLCTLITWGALSREPKHACPVRESSVCRLCTVQCGMGRYLYKYCNVPGSASRAERRRVDYERIADWRYPSVSDGKTPDVTAPKLVKSPGANRYVVSSADWK